MRRPARRLAGYSYVLDQVADTTPDTATETAARAPASPTGPTAPGTSTCAPSTTPATAARPATTRCASTPRYRRRSAAWRASTHPVQATWYANNDAGAELERGDRRGAELGVAGYSYVLDQVADTTPDTRVEAARRRATPTRADGIWYFHVRAVDAAGNGGATSTTRCAVDVTAAAIVSIASSTHPSRRPGTRTPTRR